MRPARAPTTGPSSAPPDDGRDVHDRRVADERYRYRYKAEPRGPQEQRDAANDAGYDDLPRV